MNERARAIAILKQAREMLAERLTERVLEGHEDLLEDAAGFSYMGEIEAIYEQLGSKLVHISQMISNLPPTPEAPAETAGADDASGGVDGGGIESIIVGGPVGLKTPALPGPATSEFAAPARQASFQTFAMQIQSGDIESAGQTLSLLFGVEPPRGIQCAAVFAERLENEPGFLAKAMQLRKELEKDGINAAIMLLYECFGLTGLECIGVLQTLRSKLKSK